MGFVRDVFNALMHGSMGFVRVAFALRTMEQSFSDFVLMEFDSKIHTALEPILATSTSFDSFFQARFQGESAF